MRGSLPYKHSRKQTAVYFIGEERHCIFATSVCSTEVSPFHSFPKNGNLTLDHVNLLMVCSVL